MDSSRNSGSTGSSSDNGSRSSKSSKALSETQWFFSPGVTIWQCQCMHIHTTDLHILRGEKKCDCSFKRPLYYACAKKHMHSEATTSLCYGYKEVNYLLDLNLVQIVESKYLQPESVCNHWYCFSCQLVIMNAENTDFSSCARCGSIMERLRLESLWLPDSKASAKQDFGTQNIVEWLQKSVQDKKDVKSNDRQRQMDDILSQPFHETVEIKGSLLPFWCDACGFLNTNSIIQDCGFGRQRIKCKRCGMQRQGKWICPTCTFKYDLKSSESNRLLLPFHCTLCPSPGNTTKSVAITYDCSALVLDPKEEHYLVAINEELKVKKLFRGPTTMRNYINTFNLINPDRRREEAKVFRLLGYASCDPKNLNSLSRTLAFFLALMERRMIVDQVCCYAYLRPQIGHQIELWDGCRKLKLFSIMRWWSLLSEETMANKEAAYVAFLLLQQANLKNQYKTCFAMRWHIVSYLVEKTVRQHSLLTLLEACHIKL